MPRIVVALCAYLQHCYGSCTGLSFVDSTDLAVCHNRRIKQHRVFEVVAERGRTSVDCLFGFKLHMIVNDCGEILNCCVTPANTDAASQSRKWSARFRIALASYSLTKVLSQQL